MQTRLVVQRSQGRPVLPFGRHVVAPCNTFCFVAASGYGFRPSGLIGDDERLNLIDKIQIIEKVPFTNTMIRVIQQGIGYL